MSSHSNSVNLVSPHNDRFLRITQKLNNFQINCDNQKISRLDLIENKLRHTDEKLQELFLNYSKKFNGLRDDVFF